MQKNYLFENIEFKYGLIFVKSENPINYLSCLLTKNYWSYLGFLIGTNIFLINAYDGTKITWCSNINDIYKKTLTPDIEIRKLSMNNKELNIYKNEVINIKYNKEKNMIKKYIMEEDDIKNGFYIINKIITKIYDLNIDSIKTLNTIILPHFSINSPIKIIIPNSLVYEDIYDDFISSYTNEFVKLFIENKQFRQNIKNIIDIKIISNTNIIIIENIEKIGKCLDNHTEKKINIDSIIESYNIISKYYKLKKIKIKQHPIFDNMNLNIDDIKLELYNDRQLEELLHYISSLNNEKFINLQNHIIKRLSLVK